MNWRKIFTAPIIGGGGKKPAAISSIAQWLNSLKPDGITLNDKLELVTEPTLVGRNVVDLDGTSDTFEVDAGPVGTKGFSVSAWVKIPLDMGTNSHNIFGSDQDGDRSFRVYVLYSTGTIRFLSSVDGSGGGVVTSECLTDLRDNLLHHIYVYYVDGRVHFYVDGVKINSNTAATTVYQSPLPITLLSANNGSSIGHHYKGEISEVKHTRENEALPVIFIWGQSNAAGNGGDYGTLTPAERGTQPWSISYNNPVPHVLPENFVDYPLQCLGTYYSVEVQICLDTMSQLGKRCAVIKYAQGGTAIADFMKGGQYYQPMVDTYQNAISALEAKGYAPYQYKFITLHGEADSAIELAPSYESNFDQMVSDLESDLGVQLANNIFVSRIVGTAGTEGSLIIKQAQADIGSRSGNRWFNNDGRPTLDGVHINGAGFAQLGGEMSSIIIEELANVETEDTIFDYSAEEGAGGWYDRSGNSYHSTDFDPAWTTIDGHHSTNHTDGFTKYINFKQSTARMILNGATTFGEDDFTMVVVFNYTADGNHQVLLSSGTFTEFELRVSPANVVEGLALGGQVLAEAIGDGWHTAIFSRTDLVLGLQIDGGTLHRQLVPGAILGSGDFVAGVRSVSGGLPFTGDIKRIEITSPAFSGTWTAEDSQGTTVKDSSGGGNDATLLDTTYKYIPALIDGASAADGLPLTNSGGYVHNGSECGILQSDSDPSIFGGRTFWGDGSSWNAKYYSDFIAHYNGETNTFFKVDCNDGAPIYKEAVQYMVDKEFD